MKLVLLKRCFEKGDILFNEGDPGKEAFIIRSGYVSIWKSEGGRRIELATRGPGEIIGEMALIDNRLRSASVSAKDTVVAEIITAPELRKMLETSPEPITRIIHQLLERLRDMNELAAMGAK